MGGFGLAGEVGQGGGVEADLAAALDDFFEVGGAPAGGQAFEEEVYQLLVNLVGGVLEDAGIAE